MLTAAESSFFSFSLLLATVNAESDVFRELGLERDSISPFRLDARYTLRGESIYIARC